VPVDDRSGEGGHIDKEATMGSGIRTVERIVKSQVVHDGAGVKIRRIIGSANLDHLDPFLLLDYFGSDNPDDYMAGFPMHPHRGIETVTYMFKGNVAHRDSLGNSGVIGPGDLQWMTSGSGIMHEEMPRAGKDKAMFGFQLWVTLPARLKMSAPRYQEIPRSLITPVDAGNGATVKVIAGEIAGVRGPVTEVAMQPTYLDVELAAGGTFAYTPPDGHTAFAYPYCGKVAFGASVKGREPASVSESLAVFGREGAVQARATDGAAGFILVCGEPVGEPIVRWGPFAMNTQEEIETALRELQDGTFVKHG
jgi:redox-sensitive bicupin YhaK (pirin superfamily)